jgi:regulator of sirC expression with transglutaminase-like and TPR domain
MRTEGEFRALLVLLGDEEERVTSAASEALLDAGANAVSFLEEASRGPDARVRGRARLLLETLRGRSVEQEWATYAALPDDDMDLEQGWLLLSHLSADMDRKALGTFLDAIAGMVRTHMASVGGLQALGEVLFENLGFRGGAYENPEHHYINSVLERRAGIPISLATLYVLIGRRLQLPVSGVAMPGHYVARYDRREGPVFVDCFNRGHLYHYDTLSDLLASRGPGFEEQFLAPCSPRFTLFRMLNNLEKVYTDLGDQHLLERVRVWRSYLGYEGTAG